MFGTNEFNLIAAIKMFAIMHQTFVDKSTNTLKKG